MFLFRVSPVDFSQDATAGDSAGELTDVDLCWSIVPKRVLPSVLGLVWVACCVLFIAFIILTSVYIFALNVCMHHTIMLLLSSAGGSVVWGGCSEWG